MSFGPYYCTGSSVKTEQLITIGRKTEKYRIESTDPEFRLKSKKPLIDVVNDFVWTVSPINKNNNIPVAYLTELRQSQNSIISSALYYINTVLNSPTSKAASQALDWVTTKISNATSGFLPSSKSTDASDSDSVLRALKRRIDGLVNSGVDKQLLGEYLRSYIGLYITQATGFKYALPFFEGVPHNISNSWQTSTQIKNPFTSTLEKSMDWVDRAASTFNIMTPGTYIEKPKYFQYPGEGESITIKFPLINTYRKGTEVPYQQNYELLWILAYQNKPFRTSFSRILPPKLYNVSIPGVKYMPYAYISKMDVNFLGTRRELPVNTPVGTITTSIPEAYEVSITLTSLLADTGNLMINKGFRDQVKVTVKGD